MNILIVDDQLSVLDGLKNGIDFSALQIANVFTACNVADAKAIIQSHEIHLLLSDIEMPGENGLELNKWVSEQYPEIVRILLTAHASFTYARESLKFGCFDYIVQPAPYHEISEVLQRAVSKILQDRQRQGYYSLEAMSNLVFSLFSSNPANTEHAMVSLNQVGYPINADSHAQAVIIDIYPYYGSVLPAFSNSSLLSLLLECGRETFTGTGIYTLICLNRFRQFVLLLFCNSNALENLSPVSFQIFYDRIKAKICPEISCYVTPKELFSRNHEMILPAHQLLENNVAKEAGLYFSDRDIPAPENTSLSENVTRWLRLLQNSQFALLEENIYAFLDYNTSLHRFNLEALAKFHQELTKLLFVYSYEHKIEIMGLFTESYTYNDYMSCFKNVKALKTGISFLIQAIGSVSGTAEEKDAVPRAIEYILDNLSKDISVKDVAEYVNFSPEYFSKLFKKETGENVKNYILRIKIDAAKDLLKQPNIPISMVASDLGYSNFSHFTQMFRKHESLTPSEYRKQILGGGSAFELSEKQTEEELL